MGGKLRFGVFGTWRGESHISAIAALDNAVVTAICDKDPEKIKSALRYCPENVKICRNYDELLDSGIDVVILSNYFNEHVPYAIKALEKGIHVYSECLAASNMKECVELIEAVEKNGCIYAMAENAVFFRSCMEMTRVFGTGILGEVMYAEAEYCHPSSIKNSGQYTPNPEHWRCYLPKTYYLSHCLGPLMVMTGNMPKKVIGKVTYGREYNKKRGRQGGDGAGIILVEMDNGVVFRITGTASYGPESHWFRLACEKGGIESVRGTHDQVSLFINRWDLSDDLSYSEHSVYETRKDDDVTAMKSGGHDGADYRTAKAFVDDVLSGRKPYMDVYRSVAISETAILSWRSVLNNSEQLEIPDLSDPEIRELYRHDTASPFPGQDNPNPIPHIFYND